MSTYEQGKLFRSETHSSGTEPAHPSVTGDIMEPSFPDSSSDQEQQTPPPVAYYSHNDDMLGALKQVVRDISAVNTRGGFPLADESAIHDSASRRRMTDTEAVERAFRNGEDISRHAQSQFDKLALRVEKGLGLLSLMGVDTSSLRVPSFQEFNRSVSGEEHKTTRRRLYRSNQWKSEFNDLLTKNAGPTPESADDARVQDSPRRVGESSQPPVMYSKYAARFWTLKEKDGDPTHTTFDVFDRLVVRNNGFPNGVVLSPQLDRAFVRNPSAYKARLRIEGEEYVPEEDYRHKLSDKITTQDRIITALTNKLELLEAVDLVIRGEDSDISHGATILQEAVELFETEVEAIGKAEDWTDIKLSQENENLHAYLFPGLQGKSTLKARWNWMKGVVGSHVSEQKRLFELNVSLLGKDFNK